MGRPDEKVVWFDYDALQTYSDDDVGLFCLSDRDLSMVLSCLRYVTWTARWYEEDGKRLRDDAARATDLQDAIDRAERLIARLMTDKCSDLSDTFAALVTALESVSSGGGCGCGGGGAGATDEPESGSDWGDINEPPDLEDPPDGFDDWDEYRDYKCSVATWIMDNLVSDAQWLQTADVVGLSLAGLAFGLLTPIPGDELFALLSLLIGALAISTGAIGVVETALTDDYDELLCALYLADNAGLAKTNFWAAWSTAIDSATADTALRAILKLTGQFWVNFIGINKLFDRDEDFEGLLPVGDCSECALPQWWDCSNGTPLAWTEDTVDMAAVAVGPDWLSTCGLTSGPGISSQVIDGAWSAPTGPDFATAWEVPPVDVSCGDGAGSPWDNTQSGFNGGPHANAARLLHRSGTNFTVRFTKLT